MNIGTRGEREVVGQKNELLLSISPRYYMVMASMKEEKMKKIEIA
jgi:hypothetical protein